MSESGNTDDEARPHVPDRSRVTGLWTVCALSGVFIAAHAMIGLLIPLAAARAGVPPTGIGALMSAQFVLPLLLAIPIGGLLDGRGPRMPLRASGGVMVAVPWIAVLVPGIIGLLAVALLAGLAQLTFVLAAQQLVASHGEGPAGERAFGWFSTLQSAGRMVGPLLAGVLVDVGGAGIGFAGAAAVYAAAALGTLRVRRGPAPVRPSGGGGWRSRTRERARTVAAYPGVRIAILVSSSVLVAHTVRQTFLPVYLEDLAFSGTRIGMVMATVGLASMAVRPFVPQVVRLVGGRSAGLMVTAALVAAGVAATSFLTGFAPLVVAMALVGIGSGVTQPLSMATVSDHVPRSILGFALGFRMTGNRGAQLAAPLLLGLVAEAAGVRWVFLVSAAILVGVFPLLLRWRRAFERAERKLQEERTAGSEANDG